MSGRVSRGSGGSADEEYGWADALNDALSGDLAGDETLTGTPPAAGTSGVAGVTGLARIPAAVGGLLAQSNSREVQDVARTTWDPGHEADIPADTWADDAVDVDAEDVVQTAQDAARDAGDAASDAGLSFDLSAKQKLALGGVAVVAVGSIFAPYAEVAANVSD